MRETRGYEPFSLHALSHLDILGGRSIQFEGDQVYWGFQFSLDLLCRILHRYLPSLFFCPKLTDLYHGPSMTT